MLIQNLLNRIIRKYNILTTKYLFRRIMPINLTRPIISFSFDDAPRTAFTIAGNILDTHQVKATYYISLGLLGSDSPSGMIASLEDLHHAVEQGHELGCHSFHHYNPRKTKTDIFEQSVLKNRKDFSRILPEYSLKTFAYPITGPRPLTKKRVGRLFDCCRVGGQKFNVGKTDLNYIKAFFLDRRADVTINDVKKIIMQNSKYKGWLIFATHDVQDNPSRYGCNKNFFQEVVGCAVSSNALVMPVGKACEHILNQI